MAQTLWYNRLCGCEKLVDSNNVPAPAQTPCPNCADWMPTPELYGTPKQISWAEDLRRPMYEKILTAIKKGVPMSEDQKETIAKVLAIDDAEVWIETRGNMNELMNHA